MSRATHFTTVALLVYSRSIPTFLLNDDLNDFVRRVEAGGIEPHLSFFIDIGRRLSYAGRCGSEEQGS